MSDKPRRRTPSLAPMRLRAALERLRSGLWFLPAVAAAVALALGLIALESRLGLKDAWPFLFGIRADGARETLSAIAGSMVTVAGGVVFSITIVVLSPASSQYSPRVLRNFMRDRATQAVLGVFVAVFAYSLVTLLTIRSQEDGGDFMPALAVLGSVTLAFVAIGFLVYFIHHIAVAIQAAHILYVSELAASSVNFAVCFCTEAQQANVLRVSDRVATGIKLALDRAGIDMPYPYTVVVLQDAAGTGAAGRPGAGGKGGANRGRDEPGLAMSAMTVIHPGPTAAGETVQKRVGQRGP